MHVCLAARKHELWAPTINDDLRQTQDKFQLYPKGLTCCGSRRNAPPPLPWALTPAELELHLQGSPCIQPSACRADRYLAPACCIDLSTYAVVVGVSKQLIAAGCEALRLHLGTAHSCKKPRTSQRSRTWLQMRSQA